MTNPKANHINHVIRDCEDTIARHTPWTRNYFMVRDGEEYRPMRRAMWQFVCPQLDLMDMTHWKYRGTFPWHTSHRVVERLKRHGWEEL